MILNNLYGQAILTIHLEYSKFSNQNKPSTFLTLHRSYSRTSHDFEDIIYILDNKIDLVDSILNSPEDVLNFLKTEFQIILADRTSQEAVLGNLFYETRTERFNFLMTKLKQIVQGK